jgi:hypothetical protein
VESKNKDTGPSNRSFGFTFTVVFAMLTALAWWRGWPGAVVYPVLAVGTLAATLMAPDLLSPLNRLWMRFGDLLHSIVNPVVMGVIYYIAVTPMALVMRMIGRDAMKRNLDRNAATYWEERSDFQQAAKGFERQF